MNPPKSSPNPTAFGEELIADMNANQLKLHTFTKLTKVPNVEPWNSLRVLYRSPRLRDKAVAMIANGCISSGKTRFLLSQSIFKDYLKLDKNMHRKTIGGTEFKAIVHSFLGVAKDAEILKCVQKPTGKEESRAGLYEITYPKILNFINNTKSPTGIPTGLPTDQPSTELIRSDRIGVELINHRDSLEEILPPSPTPKANERKPFNHGDRVVCVDPENDHRLTAGREYRIASVEHRGAMVHVEGLSQPFAATRFEAIEVSND